MLVIPVDYVFSDLDRKSLVDAFNTIKANPYSDYPIFDQEVQRIVNCAKIAQSFYDFCLEAKNRNQFDEPFVHLRACPIDDHLPFLDYESPVTDKRNRKNTFVSEAFLLFYSKLMQQEPIGYINVNDGDVFQDIHPWKECQRHSPKKH